MTTLFAYSNAAGDFRLTQILNRDEQDKTLSQFDYLYNADGLITKWTQQLGTIISSAKKWKPQYGLVDQLAGVEVLNAGETAILKSYGYGYDQAGNRTTEQVGDHTAGQLSVTVTEAEFNAQNQLTDRQNSGPMPVRFAGTVNEPAKTLTINGTPATVRNDQSFVGWTDLSPGPNSVTLQATDYGDNSTSASRTVNVQGGVAKVPGYDANGNMISVLEPATGQTTTYTYDGEDRLVQVLKAGVTYTLTYDGLSRMRKLQTGGTTKSFMWLGSKMAEERDATGATVVKQYFERGVRDNGVNKFYTFDHLGSIRELVGANGSTVLARYEYDPYGRRTRTTGTQDADFGFTGHYYHAPTGLHLALYRAYDADLGRWLSRDPIAEAGGINLYAYVGNSPITLIDPLGLNSRTWRSDDGEMIWSGSISDMPEVFRKMGYRPTDTSRAYQLPDGTWGFMGDSGVLEPSLLGDMLIGGVAGFMRQPLFYPRPMTTFGKGIVCGGKVVAHQPLESVVSHELLAAQSRTLVTAPAAGTRGVLVQGAEAFTYQAEGAYVKYVTGSMNFNSTVNNVTVNAVTKFVEGR